MEQQLYAEAGCKPKQGPGDYAIQAGLVIVCVAAAFIALFTPVHFLVKLAAVACFAGVVYVFPNFKFEYEYIFCDGQLDFDKIMGGARRKTALQVDFDQIDCIVPEDSHSAQGFHDARVLDFSSKDPAREKYVILCKVKEQKTKIYFEPSQRMLLSMQTKAPRKVEIKN